MKARSSNRIPNGVNHAYNPDELVSRGRDIEARVLSRALRLHAEGRVFIDGHRTVVFSK